MLKSVLIVAAGSALGGVCRFLLSRLVQTAAAGIFPWGTLTVNILGSLLIGLIYGLAARHTTLSPAWLLFLATGFCGGLTTFSTFIHENYLLFSPSRFGLLLLYATASLALGLASAWLGHAATRLL